MQGRQEEDELTAPALGGRSRPFWKGWGLALGLTTLIVVLATLPPFVGPGLRSALMHGFSTVCHQLTARSPAIDGVQLAVCHRCYGIYWGLPLAVLGFLMVSRWDDVLNRYARYILPAALVPAGIDWILGLLGLWHNTPTSRLVTGMLFGLVAGYYFARALTDAFTAPKPSPPKQPSVLTSTSAGS